MGHWRDRTGAAGALAASFATVAEAAAERAAWADLLAAAADPNPFYGPDYLAPLVEELAPPGELRALVVREASPEGGGRMVGLLPVVVSRGVPGLLPRRIEAFLHPMIIDATPLLRADRVADAAGALLDALAAYAPGALLRIPLCVAGATRDAILAEARARGYGCAAAGAFTRAVLRREGAEAAISGRKARDLRRLERRLAERGEVRCETLEGPAAGPAVEAFLAIEASGWKGAQGTALAARPPTLRFARRALSPAARAPRIVVDLLSVGAAPVAAAIHLAVGDRGGTFKVAYDERYAKGSPGVVLDAYTVRAVAAGGPLATIDSFASAGHPIESLWTGTIEIADLVVLLDPAAPAGRVERLAARIETAKRWTRAAKRFVKRLVGRRETALREPARAPAQRPCASASASSGANE